MASLTFTVKYPRGFLDKGKTISQGVRVNNYTNKDIERFGCSKKNVLPLNIPETSITLPLEKLILTFNNIIKTYKLNPDTYLALNNISDILTDEESVLKYALIKLNGTHGRCIIIDNSDPSTSISFPIVKYNPVLKETKTHLLILFNRFLNYKDKNKEDIIMYEGHHLFIHLYAIIIDSFHSTNPDVQIKKDCTNTFSMITLLELLLNKKHKNILNFYINNIALPISEIDENINHDDIANDDSGDDDEWDKEDFDPLKNIITLPIIPPIIPSVIIPSNTIIKSIIEDYNKTDTKNEDKINDKIEDKINDKINKITDDIPDDWDSI